MGLILTIEYTPKISKQILQEYKTNFFEIFDKKMKDDGFNVILNIPVSRMYITNNTISPSQIREYVLLLKSIPNFTQKIKHISTKVTTSHKIHF